MLCIAISFRSMGAEVMSLYSTPRTLAACVLTFVMAAATADDIALAIIQGKDDSTQPATTARTTGNNNKSQYIKVIKRE